MPPKAVGSAAAYAKDKRDKEVAARTALDNVIPPEYFDGDTSKDDTTYNPTTKVMKAATAYITKLRDERPAANNAGSVSTTTAPSVADLQQAAGRCAQKAEEKMKQAGGLDGELREVVRKGYDLLVDITDMLEQGGMTPQQKRKWAEEQASWGREFNLQ